MAMSEEEFQKVFLENLDELLHSLDSIEKKLDNGFATVKEKIGQINKV